MTNEEALRLREALANAYREVMKSFGLETSTVAVAVAIPTENPNKYTMFVVGNSTVESLRKVLVMGSKLQGPDLVTEGGPNDSQA